jgi:hypothetical protein
LNISQTLAQKVADLYVQRGGRNWAPEPTPNFLDIDALNASALTFDPAFKVRPAFNMWNAISFRCLPAGEHNVHIGHQAGP